MVETDGEDLVITTNNRAAIQWIRGEEMLKVIIKEILGERLVLKAMLLQIRQWIAGEAVSLRTTSINRRVNLL